MIRKQLIITLFATLSAISLWGEQRIVPLEIAESENYRLAAEFLCHYRRLLSQYGSEAVSDTIRRIKEDGFKYLKGSDKDFKRLSGEEDFSISFGNEGYQADWSRDGKSVVECVFPANIELLTFSNKIALENSFIQSLSSANGCQEEIDIPYEDMKDLAKISGSEFYIKDKGFYITPRLSHQKIFAVSSSDSTKCVLLIDTNRYQLESIANMMLSGFTTDSIDVNVKVDQYGHKSTVVNVPFQVLYNLLSSNDSIPYWGTESFDGKMVKGLYVWTNAFGGYNHLLSVSIPVSSLTEPATIDATLYCYIRTDNLKSLFEEYRQ